MGNCQAAEASTVVIVHPGPGYKVDRIYCSVTAADVMNSNPGHYVAQLVVKSPTLDNELPVKQLKLLQPHHTLLIGQVYRLITYQDVLKEFAAKKCVKLGKLLMERGVIEPVKKKKQTAVAPAANVVTSVKYGSRRGKGGKQEHQSHGRGQWKPALNSISELGTNS
ncbi:hypothetical protein QVD17_04850 [Tagetes erecta]|uniref:Uncharacterized protein n=1 Tax=Tagetes erecta TaxID=13708 RepID=A0AAD8P4W4_TARER|nr:hypothetical protein QVD17_04850 [Tagetes erecta]